MPPLLPNFIIIGAQKAATTSLWQYLGRHPSVFVSVPKETNFFIAEQSWPRGIAWYESLFEPAAELGATAVGEASPNYTMFPTFAGVPERIASVDPAMRLIYLLRDPVERMRASYLHALTLGTETRPIEEALLADAQYTDPSRYSLQIERYLRCFDRSQLLLLLTEDLERAPGETLDRVLEFLGLPTGWRYRGLGVRRHRTEEKRVPRQWARRLGGLMIRAGVPEFPSLEPIRRSALVTRRITPADTALTQDVRRELEALLRPDVMRLRRYLGDEFEGWGLLASG